MNDLLTPPKISLEHYRESESGGSTTGTRTDEKRFGKCATCRYSRTLGGRTFYDARTSTCHQPQRVAAWRGLRPRAHVWGQQHGERPKCHQAIRIGTAAQLLVVGGNDKRDSFLWLCPKYERKRDDIHPNWVPVWILLHFLLLCLAPFIIGA
jgi:hypothetical protein